MSKHVYAVFVLHASEIFDVIFAAPRPAVIQAFMQAVLDIRTGRFNLKSHNHILQCTVFAPIYLGEHHDDDDCSCSDGDYDCVSTDTDSEDSDDSSDVHRNATDIDENTETCSDAASTDELTRPPSPESNQQPPSPELIRKYVGLAHSIHSRAHSAMNNCFDHFEELQPFPWASTRTSHALVSRSPSWTEEQRALLSFWRVQFFNELKLAGMKGRLKWSARSNGILKRKPLRKFYRGSMALCQAEFATRHLPRRDICYDAYPRKTPNALRLSLLTNAHSLWPIGLSDLDRDGEFSKSCAITTPPTDLRYPGLDATQQARRLEDVHPQLCPSRTTLVDSAGKRHQRDTSDSQGSYWWQASNVIGLANRTGVEWANISRETMGLEIHASSKNNRYAGLLKRNGFFQFHRFGMGLWDQKRLVDLGLWTDEKPLLEASRYYHRWQYLLQGARCTESKEDWFFEGDDTTPVNSASIEGDEVGCVRF